jgi:hypothetical protein
MVRPHACAACCMCHVSSRMLSAGTAWRCVGVLLIQQCALPDRVMVWSAVSTGVSARGGHGKA